MRFPFREIHQFVDAQRNFEYLEVHGQFDSTVAGGDLTGTLPNPTLATPTFTPLSLATNVTAAAGSYTPSAAVQGGVVRLRGGMANGTGGSIAAGTTWATLPVAMRPSVQLYVGVGVNSTGGFNYTGISAAGLVIAGVAIANTGVMFLDGVTFTIA